MKNGRKWPYSYAVYPTFLAFLLGLSSCGTFQRSGSQPTSFASDDPDAAQGLITQAELQDDLLRFESRFNAHIETASQKLETSANPQIRYRAAMNRLIYSSNSLNIALGMSPEANLLDMVTFVELSHDALKRHWIPRVYKASGQELDDVFSDLKRQIWAIAEKVLSSEQRDTLRGVIFTWRNKHPEQIHVETVRLSAFSTEAGAKAAGLDQDVGGLFASVQQTTQAVDSAQLFAERALYYAERLPFLLRLQARLGVSEILDDTSLSLGGQLADFSSRQGSIKSLMGELQHTLRSMRATLGDAHATVKSVSQLMEQMSEDPQAVNSATATIAQLTALLKEWNQVISSPSAQKGVSQMVDVAGSVKAEGDRLLKKLAWLGVGLIAFFWVMYVLARLAYNSIFVRAYGPLGKATSEEQEGKRAA